MDEFREVPNSYACDGWSRRSNDSGNQMEETAWSQQPEGFVQ